MEDRSDNPHVRVEQDVVETALATTVNDRLDFVVSIECRGRPWPFRTLRDEIRKAVRSISGLAFEDMHVAMRPDPYLFEDPDNLPEGAR